MGVTIAVGCGIGVGLGSDVEVAVGPGIAVGDIGVGEGVTAGVSVATGTTWGVGVLMTTGVGVGACVPTGVTLDSRSASQAIVVRIIVIAIRESRILTFNMEPHCEQNLATCHSRRVPCVSLTRGHKSQTLTRTYALISYHSNPTLWHCQIYGKVQCVSRGISLSRKGPYCGPERLVSIVPHHEGSDDRLLQAQGA